MKENKFQEMNEVEMQQVNAGGYSNAYLDQLIKYTLDFNLGFLKNL